MYYMHGNAPASAPLALLKDGGKRRLHAFHVVLFGIAELQRLLLFRVCDRGRLSERFCRFAPFEECVGGQVFRKAFREVYRWR
jgi:hypothetical protein